MDSGHLDSNISRTRTAADATFSSVISAAPCDGARGQTGAPVSQSHQRVPQKSRHGLRLDDGPEELQVMMMWQNVRLPVSTLTVLS